MAVVEQAPLSFNQLNRWNLGSTEDPERFTGEDSPRELPEFYSVYAPLGAYSQAFDLLAKEMANTWREAQEGDYEVPHWFNADRVNYSMSLYKTWAVDFPVMPTTFDYVGW